MKKIPKDKIDRNFLKESRNTSSRSHRGNNAPVYDLLAELEIGEGLLIRKEEWFGNTSLATSIHGLTRVYPRGKNHKMNGYVFTNLGREFVGKKFITNSINDGYYIIREVDKDYRKSFEELIEKYDKFLVSAGWPLAETG